MESSVNASSAKGLVMSEDPAAGPTLATTCSALTTIADPRLVRGTSTPDIASWCVTLCADAPFNPESDSDCSFEPARGLPGLDGAAPCGAASAWAHLAYGRARVYVHDTLIFACDE